MPSCCVPVARLPDRSPNDGTEASWGAAGALLLIAVPGRGCRGPAGPPQRPQGGLGHATRRAPASGDTSQPAKSPQSKGAGSRCQIPCPYALRASSQTLQHRLGIQPFHSRLRCHISRRFSARKGSFLRHSGMRYRAPDEVRACSAPL